MRYTESHVWIDLDEDDIATVGVSAAALEQLGPLRRVDLPDEGDSLTADETVATIESDDASFEVLAPCDGTVIEVHQALDDDAGPVEEDPEAQGWLFRIEVDDPEELEELMSESAYRRHAGL